MLRRTTLPGLVVCCTLACARPQAGLQADRSISVDAGVDPELESLRSGVLGLEREAAALLQLRDEALWNHWTTGAPLDLSKVNARRDALTAPASLELLRRASARPVDDPRALEHLELFLLTEKLAAETAAEREALATLEDTLTFPFEGKAVRWRDLNRLLATEKSALKRKALWAASWPAAKQVDAALAARDDKAASILAPLQADELFARQRDVDPEAMRRFAEGVLTLTSEAWRLTVERLTAAELKLPVASLTRADLPRLLRVPADVELAFDQKTFAPRAIELLSGLGLYGQSGLTLDLADAARKQPLPLTVAPGGPADVRLSVRPLGGLRDQQLLLSELGVALALRHAATGRLAFDRLGDPALANTSGELLALLPLEPAWLSAVGVRPEAHAAIIEAATAQRLFRVRRAAASYLARVETGGPTDAQARTRAAAIFTRALGVTHTEADMERLRLETDEAWRGVTTLRAMLLAEALRASLVAEAGPSWFREPATGESLKALWQTGTRVPAEARIAPLGEALTRFWERTITLTPVGQPADGGVAVRDWPSPREAVDRPMSTVRPWPHPIGPRADGGVEPIQWTPKPGPHSVGISSAGDAGVSASP